MQINPRKTNTYARHPEGSILCEIVYPILCRANNRL